MRYAASDKLEINWLVEQFHLPVKHTLDKIGVSRPTFYRWYDIYRDRSGRSPRQAKAASVEPHSR